jgi:protease I
VAVLIADIFEDLELWYPILRLREARAEVTVVGPKVGTFTGKRGTSARSDVAAADAVSSDFDAVVIPGGYAPDHMRRDPAMVQLVRAVYDSGGIVAAICHGGWMLASAGIVDGRQVTGFHSIRDDMVNAGAEFVDREVVEDERIITSRTPDDLPAFARTILAGLSRSRSRGGG